MILADEEDMNYVNYPVLRSEQQNIEDIVTYGLRAYSALTDYNEALYDRVDINTAELEEYINLSRQVCSRLSDAESVPFDLLLELRSILAVLYQLRVLAVEEKGVVGKPSAVEEGSGL